MAERTQKRDGLVAFRVSPAEKRELKLLAKAEGASASEVIRRAVRTRAEAISTAGCPGRADESGEGGAG